jgi:integrase
MVDLDIKYGYNNEISKFSPKRTGFRIKTFTPHQLRHTYATMLYRAGMDAMEAKYQLGHSDIKVTLGIYTHFEKQFKQTSINKLDAFLGHG